MLAFFSLEAAKEAMGVADAVEETIRKLANVYAQSQYLGEDPLVIFADWHVKPH